MKGMQNLHTHTTFCDGADTPEEMILGAIEKGFNSIGFSGHSYMDYAPEFAERGDLTAEYKKTVTELKGKYKDKIEVYLGLEEDMYSCSDLTGYDYLIGAVHFLKYGNEYLDFDRRETHVEAIIDKYFDKDGIKYAKAYYEALAQLPEYGKFDIVAHFDLVTKHCENREFFDTSSKEYMNAALETAHALAGKIPFFEVNTGAIARGYRKTPYPCVPILKELKNLGFGAVISSDCHDKRLLDCNFDQATELLKSCGFKEKYILTHNGFCAVSL